MHQRYLCLFSLVLACFALSFDEGAPSSRAAAGEEAPKKRAPFVPSPMPVVEAMLALAGVTDKDVVYDLGSGDGRVVIAAAKRYGAHAVGLEIDPALVEKARQKAQHEGVEHLVEFRQQDVTTADFSEATVVTLYMFPEVNRLLKPRLQRQLRPGARVVSSQFDLGDWEPSAFFNIRVETEWDRRLRQYTLYLWRIE